MSQPGSSRLALAVTRGLSTTEICSSSSDTGRPTPESSSDDSLHGGDEEERDGILAADALMREGHEDVYELRQGRKRPNRLDLEGAHYESDHESVDDHEEAEEPGAVAYTAEEERAVVRKFDRRLVLFVALLYLLSFLDRSNIGNALVAGMDQDLLQATDPMGSKKGSDEYYEWALTAFYIAYIAFEWLSLMWTVIPAHIYVSVIVLSWGVTASLQAVATSYPGLIALRFLLGIGEAGFTGIPIFLSFFFRREELALRTAVFISAAPLATSFASSIAWVITKLGESGPIAPWRLLFLLEGFPAVVVATFAWRIIPDAPERAPYLTRREKRIARQRLLPSGGRPTHRSATSSRAGGEDVKSAAGIRAVLADPVPWTTAAILFLTNMAYASLPVFLPSILTQMGHSPLASQALAAPPYLVSFLVVLAVARVSDALQGRARLIAAAALASSAGYAFLALSHNMSRALPDLNMARYLAVYPAAAGFFCVVVLTIAWNVNNSPAGGHKGGAAFALMQVFGQCGPLVGVRLYPKTDGPWFTRGMGICAVAMFGVAVLAVGLRAYLARVNSGMDRKEKERGVEGEGLVRRTRRHDGFRYML